MTITVTARNPTEQPVTITTGMGCQLDFVVETLDGTLIGQSMLGCTAVVTSRTLAPGDSLSQSFRWGVALRQGELQQALPPGSYAVRGVVLAGPRRSAPVELRVR